MKQMYYQNRECGNILTYSEMLKEWAELYDGATPQTPAVGWNTTPALAPSSLNEGVFLRRPPTTASSPRRAVFGEMHSFSNFMSDFFVKYYHLLFPENLL